jgi:hypothetical protein
MIDVAFGLGLVAFGLSVICLMGVYLLLSKVVL